MESGDATAFRLTDSRRPVTRPGAGAKTLLACVGGHCRRRPGNHVGEPNALRCPSDIDGERLQWRDHPGERRNESRSVDLAGLESKSTDGNGNIWRGDFRTDGLDGSFRVHVRD